MPGNPLNQAKLNPDSRILICVTTCGRPDFIRPHLARLIGCAGEIDGADLMVAIDGLSANGNAESLDLALTLGIDCVVADYAEGVGISKNRVLALLGGYDYYFFIDDDVEVLSSRLFSGHINLQAKTGIHHFSLHHPRRLLGETTPTTADKEGSIRHAMYGGAAVNFFTRRALESVGGWHELFAKFRRGGHTEHSYRIYRAGLCPAPFNLAERLVDTCVWKDPPSVINPGSNGLKVGANRIYEVESRLIAENIQWVPFTARSAGRLIVS